MEHGNPAFLLGDAQALHVFASLIALASYLVPAPNLRLALCGVGVSFSLLATVASWYQSRVRRHRAVGTFEAGGPAVSTRRPRLTARILPPPSLVSVAVTWLLGLLLTLIVRVYGRTTNPLFPIMKRETGGLQEPLLTIAVACIIDVALRPAALPATEKTGKEGRTGNGLAAGLGLGGALFLTHWLFADSAVLSRFMGAGYPEPGPAPFPHGLSVLGALALGLVLSTVRRLVASPVWWGVAAVGGTALVYGEGYPAYAGGLVLGTYVMSVFPRLISAVAQHNPGYSVTVALLVYNLLLFADVWYVDCECTTTWTLPSVSQLGWVARTLVSCRGPQDRGVRVCAVRRAAP